MQTQYILQKCHVLKCNVWTCKYTPLGVHIKILHCSTGFKLPPYISSISIQPFSSDYNKITGSRLRGARREVPMRGVPAGGARRGRVRRLPRAAGLARQATLQKRHRVARALARLWILVRERRRLLRDHVRLVQPDVLAGRLRGRVLRRVLQSR